MAKGRRFSFSNLSNELLMKILSFVDVKSRVRSERVCKRFRNCVQQAPSWNFDSHLKLNPLNSQINESTIPKPFWNLALRKLLKNCKIESLEIRRSLKIDNSWFEFCILPELLIAKDRIKLKTLINDPLDGHLNSTVLWCLISNKETIENLSLTIHRLSNLELKALLRALNVCENIRKLTIDDFFVLPESGFVQNVTEAFIHENLTDLSLSNCFLPLNVMQTVCNSNPLQSLHLDVADGFDIVEFLRSIPEFRRNELKELSLKSFEFGPSVDFLLLKILSQIPPLLFPNVRKPVIKAIACEEFQANEVFRPVSEFLNAAKDGPNNFELNLSIRMSPSGYKDLILALLAEDDNEVTKVKSYGVDGQCTVTRTCASIQLPLTQEHLLSTVFV